MAKLKDTLTSRRFWALITALVTTAAAFAQGQITEWQAVMAIVGATSAYALAIGLGPESPGTLSDRSAGSASKGTLSLSKGANDAELARLRQDPPPAPPPGT